MTKENGEMILSERIENRILLLRGHKVMLDRDLAALYEVETRVLNQAVKRNHDRFPDDFMFELTREEIRNISQFVICSSKAKHASRMYAFTEQGVAMLSGVLKSSRAILVNIAIMRTFVRLKRMLASHEDLASKLVDLEKKYDKQFSVVFDALRQLMNTPESPRKQIGFGVRECGVAYRASRGKNIRQSRGPQPVKE